jgi:polar amino acid transport system ATP-binding protein
VRKSFGTHQVLKDVSTVFHTGEVTVIIGASGSARARCAPSTGWSPTTAAHHHRRRRGATTSHAAAQRCEVGMVFQQFNLFGHMSVLDNVTLAPRRIRRTPRAQANEQAMVLLKRVGMQDHAHKYPGSCRAGSSSAWPLPARWPCSPR